jgi:hypothetical protein
MGPQGLSVDRLPTMCVIVDCPFWRPVTCHSASLMNMRMLVLSTPCPKAHRLGITV